MKQLKTFENTIKYYELTMTLDDLESTQTYPLPQNFKFAFWQNDKDTQSWIDIHLSTGEFASYIDATKTFKSFYNDFLQELCKRMIFIEDEKGKKIATATLSPSDDKSYPCVIDWFAVSKDCQGKKLAKPLLSKIIETAKKLGYDKILLHTQTNSWLAAKIYLDFGFEPKNILQKEGWKILKTITNHPKLNNFPAISEDEIFDPLIVKIENYLSSIYDKFDYSVWYANDRNDIYVHANDNFYEYKFFDNANKIIQTK